MKSSVEFFSPPDGNTLTDPDVAFLKKLVLTGGDDYWNSGAGQGSLKYSGVNEKKELLLTFHERNGFSLEYIDSRDVYYVSLGCGDFNHSVKVYVGGDPLILPTKFFVSRELACAAVEDFCLTGQPTPKIKWGKRSEQKWDYSCP
jgi:hypothetical protein